MGVVNFLVFVSLNYYMNLVSLYSYNLNIVKNVFFMIINNLLGTEFTVADDQLGEWNL
jgi:hypothetical protein